MLFLMTKTELTLHESGGRIAPRESGGSTYKIRVMGWNPGDSVVEGSSATYPIPALIRDIAEALPVGSRSRANHDGICESGGDIRRIVGKTTTTPWVESDGIYTNLYISPEWTGFMEQFADVIGVSISMAGEMEMADEDAEDYDPDAKPVLKRLLSAKESPYNSIDLVEAPGAAGRIVQAVEAAKTTFANLNVREQAKFAAGIGEHKSSSTSADETNEGIDMTTKEELTSALAESQSATLSAVREMLSEALPKPVAESSEAPKLEVVAEAIVSAGLTEGGRAAVYEKVDLGIDYAKAIETEKARESSIRAELGSKVDESAPAGVVFTSDKGVSVTESASFESELDKLLPGGKF